LAAWRWHGAGASREGTISSLPPVGGTGRRRRERKEEKRRGRKATYPTLSITCLERLPSYPHCYAFRVPTLPIVAYHVGYAFSPSTRTPAGCASPSTPMAAHLRFFLPGARSARRAPHAVHCLDYTPRARWTSSSRLNTARPLAAHTTAHRGTLPGYSCVCLQYVVYSPAFTHRQTPTSAGLVNRRHLPCRRLIGARAAQPVAGTAFTQDAIPSHLCPPTSPHLPHCRPLAPGPGRKEGSACHLPMNLLVPRWAGGAGEKRRRRWRATQHRTA